MPEVAILSKYLKNGKVAVRQPVTRAMLKNASNNRDSTVLTEICLFTAKRSMGLQWAGNKLD